MCKILTILNTKQENKEIIQDIINANIMGLKTERCGYSVLRQDKTDFYLGQDDYDRFEDNVKYNNENVFCIHTRTSTGGDTDKKGLHLQKFGNWFWGHNGIVGGLNVKDYSDSFYFFRALLATQKVDLPDAMLSKTVIEKTCKDLNFHGKGFLWNPKSKTLQWFCNSQSWIYLIDGAIIISTWEINLKKEEYSIASVLGYDWVYNVKTVPIEVLHQEHIDDTILTFDDNFLVQREKLDTTVSWSNNTPACQYNNYYGMTKKQRKLAKKIEKDLEKDLGKESLIDENGEVIFRRGYDD